MKLEFILAQKAKSKGGDKYVCVSDPNFYIYVPQIISRPGGIEPKTKLDIEINYVGELISE
jgi:hypothetical protein